MKLKQRTIYYQDELHDEFAGDHIKAKTWNGDEYDGGWGDTTYRYTSSICLVAYR